MIVTVQQDIYEDREQIQMIFYTGSRYVSIVTAAFFTYCMLSMYFLMSVFVSSRIASMSMPSTSRFSA